jgi:hypothetical protein
LQLSNGKAASNVTVWRFLFFWKSFFEREKLNRFDVPSLTLGLDGADDDAEVARQMQAQSDAEFARSLQNQMNSGERGPVGKLVSVGVDEEGREVLEDERGHRFVRKKKAESKEEKDESKCTIC